MILMPASPLSAVIVARTTVRSADACLRPSVPLSAIAKHAACAAAINSSGLVFPPGSPIRAGNVTGSVNAPLPALASPFPSITDPFQSTSTCRSNVAITPPRSGLRRLLTLRLLASGQAQLHHRAEHSQRDPCDR